MRYDDLYVAGLGSYLPPTLMVDDAVADGRYDEDEQLASGQVMVTVAGPEDATPRMAAAAARTALQRSGHRPDDICLVLHAVTGHSGLTGWNAGSYLQREVLNGAGLSFEVRQLSNGAMASIELAAAWLAANDDRTAVLVTAADRFDEPTWNRWRSSWGLVFADGASAAVLSRRGGFARVLSAVTVSDPHLEGAHRGAAPFAATPAHEELPIDLRARTLDFLQSVGLEETGRRMEAGLRSAVGRAVAEAGIELRDAQHIVVPAFGRQLLTRELLDQLDVDLARTTWEWSSRVGHIGAADQCAALTYLSEAGRLEAGEHVVLLGVGGGFNWSCVVLEVLGEPAWAA